MTNWSSKIKKIFTVPLDSESDGSLSPPSSLGVSSDEDTVLSIGKDEEFKAIFQKRLDVAPEIQAQVMIGWVDL